MLFTRSKAHKGTNARAGSGISGDAPLRTVAALTPSTARMAASPSGQAIHRQRGGRFCSGDTAGSLLSYTQLWLQGRNLESISASRLTAQLQNKFRLSYVHAKLELAHVLWLTLPALFSKPVPHSDPL